MSVIMFSDLMYYPRRLGISQRFSSMPPIICMLRCLIHSSLFHFPLARSLSPCFLLVILFILRRFAILLPPPPSYPFIAEPRLHVYGILVDLEHRLWGCFSPHSLSHYHCCLLPWFIAMSELN